MLSRGNPGEAGAVVGLFLLFLFSLIVYSGSKLLSKMVGFSLYYISVIIFLLPLIIYFFVPKILPYPPSAIALKEAVATNNIKWCYKLDWQKQHDCFSKVATQKGDFSFACYYTYESDEFYRNCLNQFMNIISSKSVQEIGDICAKARFDDDCYRDLATIKKDPSLCQKTTHSNNIKYLCLAEVEKNPSYCKELQYSADQDLCIKNLQDAK